MTQETSTQETPSPTQASDELTAAALARVVGGTDGLGSIDVGNDPQLKATPILF